MPGVLFAAGGVSDKMMTMKVDEVVVGAATATRDSLDNNVEQEEDVPLSVVEADVNNTVLCNEPVGKSAGETDAVVLAIVDTPDVKDAGVVMDGHAVDEAAAGTVRAAAVEAHVDGESEPLTVGLVDTDMDGETVADVEIVPDVECVAERLAVSVNATEPDAMTVGEQEGEPETEGEGERLPVADSVPETVSDVVTDADVLIVRDKVDVAHDVMDTVLHGAADAVSVALDESEPLADADTEAAALLVEDVLALPEGEMVVDTEPVAETYTVLPTTASLSTSPGET